MRPLKTRFVEAGSSEADSRNNVDGGTSSELTNRQY